MMRVYHMIQLYHLLVSVSIGSDSGETKEVICIT